MLRYLQSIALAAAVFFGALIAPKAEPRDWIPFPTLARAAGTYNSPVMQNDGGTGAVCYAKYSAQAGGTPTMTVVVQGMDAASGDFYNLFSTGQPLAVALNTPQKMIAGSFVATESGNLTVNQVPRSFRVQAVVSGAGTATFSVGCSVF